MKKIRKLIGRQLWKIGVWIYYFLDKFTYFKKKHIEKAYYEHMGKRIVIDKAKTYNEKIQWLKVYYHDYKMAICSDKIHEKEYLKEKGLNEYIPKLYGVYNKAEDIDFNKLPEKFVLKTSQGCGYVIICKDKSKLDYEQVRKQLNDWLTKKYDLRTWEWNYGIFKPRIMAEEYIESDREDGDLFDYKLICFKGMCKLAFVTMNRNSPSNMYVDFYNEKFEKQDFSRHYKVSNILLPKPKEWEKMKDIAEKVSKEFPMCRVDFYIEKNKIFIGEITFYPGSGWEEFEPEEIDLKYGKLLELPTKEECRLKRKELKKFIKEVRLGKYKQYELRD